MTKFESRDLVRLKESVGSIPSGELGLVVGCAGPVRRVAFPEHATVYEYWIHKSRLAPAEVTPLQYMEKYNPEYTLPMTELANIAAEALRE